MAKTNTKKKTAKKKVTKNTATKAKAKKQLMSGPDNNKTKFIEPGRLIIKNGLNGDKT